METNRNKICFGCVSVCFAKTKAKKFGLFFVCFGVSNLYRNDQNKPNCFVTNRTNRNNPKIFRKIPKYALFRTVWVGLLFVSVHAKHQNSLFWYWSETTETNRTKPKKPENHKFSEKIPKYAPYQSVSAGLLFVSVQSKHRNSLFWYRSETKQTEQNRKNRKTFCFR